MDSDKLFDIVAAHVLRESNKENPLQSSLHTTATLRVTTSPPNYPVDRFASTP